MSFPSKVKTKGRNAAKKVRRRLLKWLRAPEPTAPARDVHTESEYFFQPEQSPSDTAKLFRFVPEYLGMTYEADEILPILGAENPILREKLFALLDERHKLEEEGLVEPVFDIEAELYSDEEGQRFESYVDPAELVGQYLQQQSQRRGSSNSKRHLVVANDYPREGKEYGNGFIHRRIKAYLAAGIEVDVVVVRHQGEQELYSYQGVHIIAGQGPELREILRQQKYESVSAHFLNSRMWYFFQEALPDISLHVFLHGYECNRWSRRVFNFKRGTLLERNIDRTIDLQYFWRQVVHHEYGPKTFIFVSEWLHRSVSDDMQVTFPAHKVEVVHNFIDTDLFKYQQKTEDQRFNILWVRPATNRNYAFDVAIDALKELSKHPLWEKAKVTIIGDGPNFQAFKRELGKFSNVKISQGFIDQNTIAALHKKHGIFLVPSRLDSQGVSRDEAMASGLVPVTNPVAAIPEFVDQEVAILAPVDEPEKLAAGIAELWENPQKFLEMSAKAAERSSKQTGPAATISRELEILGLDREENAEAESAQHV